MKKKPRRVRERDGGEEGWRGVGEGGEDDNQIKCNVVMGYLIDLAFRFPVASDRNAVEN